MPNLIINLTRKSITGEGKEAENVTLEVEGATPSGFAVESEKTADCSKVLIDCDLGTLEQGKRSEVLGR